MTTYEPDIDMWMGIGMLPVPVPDGYIADPVERSLADRVFEAVHDGRTWQPWLGMTDETMVRLAVQKTVELFKADLAELASG